MKLDELRKQIDTIDRTIVEAINERYKLVCSIGEWKRQNNMPVYVPEREKQLLDRLTELNPGPMPTATLLAIYTEIISGARRLEEPLSVKYSKIYLSLIDRLYVCDLSGAGEFCGVTTGNQFCGSSDDKPVCKPVCTSYPISLDMRRWFFMEALDKELPQ